ncbi:hypothetical protein HKBW3S42_00052 [Candidatus Hakubella thermalkaliphila]|uniref:N-acetyltransferase domain-containing protein n=4 Tax=Candidatus Hakubella thermalkaliphila TaxID=2754717 RepID=A0A6V8PX94_9ACTN|nr:GNAT family N-acetyltransferase [Candidatus Hakubella thermalkaliphila]MBT9169771.1 Mycothiol acetyltransferase [Actinomycetota bacterium]GFP19772.1 hypothetical protein HKBW3S03_01276 [Candidatus Hakubella thermalkaliphila]GFP27030.1 hypothetical protein HKBW3S33_00443 [Candidatus Hakubella thermalkaliphila]GFP31745.1 hypothetical protein HKBW3S42_00052 [Candidatus Hakubella thermalkaliphila]GFP35361.1 hypothetical protein HKBW3S43_01153 [Candidatus Hakubella thermalkaliphila]
MKIEKVEELTGSLLIEVAELEKSTFGPVALNEGFLPVMAKYGRIYLLWDDGDRLIGVCQLLRSWSEENLAVINSFYIREENRGKGLGRYLLEKVLSEIRKEGFRAVELTVSPDNLAALKLYQRFNFQAREFKRDFYGPGLERWIFRLDLSEPSGQG